MAVRQDQVQLRVDFITDESRQLAKTLETTKQYNREVEASRGRIAAYQKQLQSAAGDEAKRAQLLQKIAAEEKNIATQLRSVAAEGKKVEALDLSKVTPAQLVQRARQLEQAMRNIPTSAAEYAPLVKQLAAVNGQLKNIRDTQRGISPTTGAGAKGGGILGSLGGIVGLAGRFIPIAGGIAGAVAGIGASLRRASDAEQLTVSFETFLGSADAAKAALKDLKEFEARTPFEADQVNEAGRALLAFGFNTEELIPILTQVGDVASGTGKDFNELVLIYGKAAAQGKIQGEELNQLAEAGIPIYDELAKVLGVLPTDIRKLGEQGKIQFTDLQRVFQNLTSEGSRFGGLMEKQSQTLGGLWSTLQSAFGDVLRQIGEQLAPLVKSILPGIISGLKFFGDNFKTIFDIVTINFRLLIANAAGMREAVKFAFNVVSNSAELFSLKLQEAALATKALFGDQEAKRALQEVRTRTAKIYEDAGGSIGDAYVRGFKSAFGDFLQKPDEAPGGSGGAAVKPNTPTIVEDPEVTRKRLEAAFEKALKAVQVYVTRQELLVENARLKGEISESDYQKRLLEIKQEGFGQQLEVYAKFRREETNEALKTKNELLKVQEQLNRELLAMPAAIGAAQGPQQVQSQTAGIAPGAATQLGNDALQTALRQRFEAALITEQEYNLASLELKRALLNEQLALLRASATPEVEAIRSKEEEKKNVEAEINQARLENQQRLNELKRSTEEAALSATSDAIGASIELLAIDEQARRKNAGVIKAFQAGQVITNGILEVQKIWATVAEYGPAGPIIGGILTAVAVARSAAAIARIRSAKFAAGGYTGSGYGAPDSTGFKPAGVVHEGEYVAPKWMVNSPEVAPVIGWLESRRLRGYATGGLVAPSTTPSLAAAAGAQVAAAGDASMLFVEELRALRNDVGTWNTTLKANVVYTDVEEAGSTLSRIRDDAAI